MNVLIYCCGVYSLGFAIFHLLFWRLFHWKKDLQKISFANRAIIQIANSRLIYLFLFTAFLCFVFAKDLYETRLGKVFMGGMALFWLGRTVEQFIFLGYSHKIVNLLTVIFIIGALLFALPVLL